MKSEDNCFWQENYGKPRQCVEKHRYYSVDKGPYSQGYGPSSGQIQLWKVDHKEGRAPKNWYLLTVVLEKEIKPVNLKGNQPWILTGRTDPEAEVPVFWPPDVNSWLIEKVPAAGKDWGQKKRRASENEMAGWHHQCNRHELEETLVDGERQGSLACCSPWGRKELNITGQLNNNHSPNLYLYLYGCVAYFTLTIYNVAYYFLYSFIFEKMVTWAH